MVRDAHASALPLSSMTRLAHRLIVCAGLAVAGSLPAPAAAHPAPFSFVDLRIQSTTIDLEVVVHAFDVAYVLAIQPPNRVLEPGGLGTRAQRLADLIRERLEITVDGSRVVVDGWSDPEPLPERQSVSLRARVDLEGEPGRIDVEAVMFPYDPQHQTFVNVYDEGALTAQAILGGGDPRYEYFVGSTQGTLAVIQRFVPQGIHHILIGPDHLLFLVGLLLLGGSLRRLLMVITAFTIAHSITLALAVLDVVSPPGSIVEPIIALSIVYVGADNLLVRGGRDMRVWIALVFGLIHGFGFASVLREMGLPTGALGWSLFSFNFGVEIGQVAVAVVVASALTWLRARNEKAGRQLAVAGSVGVIAAGTFWFVQRVFFSGGMA